MAEAIHNIVVGCDHAGLPLKQFLLAVLSNQGTGIGALTVDDVGCFPDATTTTTSQITLSVDYPDFAFKVARRVSQEASALGLLICGSGIGMCIAANKVPGIRAALCHEPYSAKMSRLHNNANVLCMGARIIGVELAKETLKSFLQTQFEGGRHQHRLDKIVKAEVPHVDNDVPQSK